MRQHCKFWSPLCVLALGCLLLGGMSITAGDKKTDKKKEPSKSKVPVFSASAELKADDEKDTKAGLTGSPRKVFALKLTGGTTYQIDLKSKNFDTYLRLLDEKGSEVAFNDDADPNTLDSRIVYKPAKTADFKIV